jgi:hypothetical protein
MTACSLDPTVEAGGNQLARIAQSFICKKCDEAFKSDDELYLDRSLDHR